MVKKVAKRSVTMPGEVNQKQLPKRAGRPVALTKGVTLNVSVTLLAKVKEALQAGAADARTPSIKNQLQDALNGLESRMIQVPRARVKGYRIVNPDGTEHVTTEIATAARLAGITPGSLRVRLSQGQGKWQRKRGANPMQVERLLA